MTSQTKTGVSIRIYENYGYDNERQTHHKRFATDSAARDWLRNGSFYWHADMVWNNGSKWAVLEEGNG